MTYQPSDKALPAIVIDHPTQMVDDEALHLRAEQIADAILRLLNDQEPENPSS
jgi:hypothetical protein